ncbi:MAG: hypothetical protein O9275_24140, partial [Microcystis sp. LE19-196.1B]|nr:hypothetical protein [Microcystis sp. LE19-196.1B]
VAININKAPTVTTVTINGGPFTYTGSAITPATVTITGAGGLNLTPAASYVNNINAGTATASYSYEESANHLASSDSKTFEIGKANATIDVIAKTVTYDGTAHGATGTAKGVMGEDLAGLNLGATFTDVPGGTANWTFTGGMNYKDQSGNVAITINKADATVNVIGYTGVYDALPHGASGTATGVGGVDLSSGLNLGSTFTDVPGGTANWTFTGGTNYKDQSGSVAIVINKADATVNVTGYTGVYDALPHGASGIATGVGGADLSSGLNLGATFTDVPGGTANWTFTGGTNYKDQSGSVAITINKADATVNVIGYNGVYDALPHGASGTATGVGGVDLSAGLNLGATFTDVPGGTANWTFTGGTNYKDQSGSVAIVINKAPTVTTVTINGGPFTYTGSAISPA